MLEGDFCTVDLSLESVLARLPRDVPPERTAAIVRSLLVYGKDVERIQILSIHPWMGIHYEHWPIHPVTMLADVIAGRFTVVSERWKNLSYLETMRVLLDEEPWHIEHGEKWGAVYRSNSGSRPWNIRCLCRKNETAFELCGWGEALSRVPVGFPLS